MMKVSELREKLADLTKEQLVIVASEFYKALPKAKKESEELLEAAFNFDKSPKEKKAPKVQVEESLASMKSEIELFVEHAKEQYYWIPSREVSKKERSTWRFKVKKWFKELTKLNRPDQDLPLQAHLLQELYSILGEQHYKYFSTDEPFESVGIEQPAFLRQLAFFFIEAHGKSAFADIAPKLVAKYCYVSNSRISNELAVVTEMLGTGYHGQMIEVCKEMIDSAISHVERARDVDSYKFRIQEFQNDIATIAMHLYAELGEIEEAVAIYKKHSRYSKEKDTEFLIYCLCGFFHCYNLVDQAEKMLEEAVAKGIKLRERLVELRTYLKEHKAFPRYF